MLTLKIFPKIMPRSYLKAVLLVDGYNIIGSWSCLQKKLMALD